MNKYEIIEILRNISLLLQIKGENFFKFAAYSKAADILSNKGVDISELINADKLSEIDGIGKALNQKITELYKTGKLKYYDDLTQEYPLELIELFKIDGLGPQKVKQIFCELKIRNIDELELACKNDVLEKLKGFTKNSSEKILKSIELIKSDVNYKNKGINFVDIQ